MKWLHISDFHFKARPGAQADAMGSLLTKLGELCQSPLDAVFLAGDIAYSGSEAEYARFESDFLAPLKTIPAFVDARVVAVPGNHDVDCDAATPVTWPGIRGRNQQIYFCENESGRRARESRVPAFAAYHKFIERNSILSPDTTTEVSRFLGEGATNLPVDLILVNTSLFSDREERSEDPITPAPLESLRDRLRASNNPSRPIIVIGHHSQRCMLREHQQPFETFLVDNRLLYLHGHEHIGTMHHNVDGAVRTIGFGAAYQSPLALADPAPYQNCFALCELGDDLKVSTYSWAGHIGRWIDSTATQFPSAAERCNSGILRLSLARTRTTRKFSIPGAVLEDLPRQHARPRAFGVLKPATDSMWLRLAGAAANARGIARAQDAKLLPPLSHDGKIERVIEQGQHRHLIICIPGLSHVLSAKEVESYNTRLDTEALASITILSLGGISTEAADMYARLHTRKNIEVVANADLVRHWRELLPVEQSQALLRFNADEYHIDAMIWGDAFYVLVTRSSLPRSFELVASDGSTLPPHHEAVVALRHLEPDIAQLPYEGSTHAHVEGMVPEPFDEAKYLLQCYEENNIVKYAGLANIGIRAPMLSLDEVYIEGSVREVESANAARVEALLDDRMASMPVSDALKSQLKAEFAESTRDSARHESSLAREYCERFGAVLLMGDPGSGKTCFVKNEILAYAKRASGSLDTETTWHSRHIPVLVQLSQFAAEPDVQSQSVVTVASRLLERKGYRIPVRDMEHLLAQGRLALFFDGLDEVVSVERRAVVVQCINDLVTRSLEAGNRIVVTSRPAAINVVNLLPTLKKVELQGLNEREIRRLACRVLSLNITEEQDELVYDIGHVNASDISIVKQIVADCRDKPGVARLAQNPLLLTLLVLIYANSGAPSAKRHRIYEEAIRTLASVRGRLTGHDPVSVQDLHERLGEVALFVYNGKSGFLPTRKQVSELVKDVMERQLKTPVSRNEADAFIQRVAESTGVIVLGTDDGKGEESAAVTFMHHSFMEYFAAVGLSRQLKDVKIEPLMSKPRWTEVLTLLAGIIGEDRDIAPVLADFIGNDGSNYGAVDARNLRFALDCALECEIPSESSIRLLCRSIENCLREGPARCDPWVRSELGGKLGLIIGSCGIKAVEGMMVQMIEQEDPDVCAASIGLVSHACTANTSSTEVIQAIEGACERPEDIVLQAICDALGRARWFRTPLTLQVVGRCLRKSDRARCAALETIAVIPGAAGEQWATIMECTEASSESVRRAASKAAIRAGLDSDLVALGESRKEVIAAALKYLHDAGIENEFMGGKVRKDTVERLLSSALQRDRLLGIELLPAVEADGLYIFRRLVGIIEERTDHRDVASALRALSSSRSSLLLFTVPHLRTITDLCTAGTGDVRRAAIHLMGRFVSDPNAVRALAALPLKDIELAEYCGTIEAIGHASVLQPEAAAVLGREMQNRLKSKRRRSERYQQEMCSLLDAAAELCQVLPDETAQAVLELVDNYKEPEGVRVSAMRAVAAVSKPSRTIVEFVTDQLQAAPLPLLGAIVEAPGVLARHCRQKVNYVRECVDGMGRLCKAAEKLHAKLCARDISPEGQVRITALRLGLRDIREIMVAFDEFVAP